MRVFPSRKTCCVTPEPDVGLYLWCSDCPKHYSPSYVPPSPPDEEDEEEDDDDGDKGNWNSSITDSYFSDYSFYRGESY